jgi:hypothetical protein
MNSEQKLWLNGFATMSLVLAQDVLAIEEVKQALEDQPTLDQRWIAPWLAGLDAALRVSFGR